MYKTDSTKLKVTDDKMKIKVKQLMPLIKDKGSH